MAQQHLTYASAYRQLDPAERAIVDRYVSDAETKAARENQSIALCLSRPISQYDVDASNGVLSRALVRAAIAERVGQIAADNDLTATRIVRELMAISFSSIADYGESDYRGNFEFDFTAVTPDQYKAVKKIKTEYTSEGVVKKVEVELHDKLSAIDKLARIIQLFDPDNVIVKRMTSTAAETPEIVAGATVDEASNTYTRYLNAR